MNIIKSENLKKYFGNVKAVDDVSFSVEKGELFGFLGVNGAGKSTVINMLATLLEPTDGNVTVCGHALGKENELIRRKIGIVWQQNCLDDILTVEENLLCRGSLYEKDARKNRASLDRVTQLLKLDDVLKRRYGKLSGGQKRRCEIAAALMHTPEILFLDEPTTGLDPATRKSVWETVGKLRSDYGMTVFLTTHYMEEAAQANHIVLLDSGKVVASGTPFELKERFAHDSLKIQPKDTAQVQAELDKLGFEHTEREGIIIVPLKATVDALPILGKLGEMINGFEVVQGTMDDVFLNACGKALND